ncbi:proline--tRNA ligase [Thermococci archaeon]|nr:MAG: proline--tRNA ligase [Thermococci archaeon]
MYKFQLEEKTLPDVPREKWKQFTGWYERVLLNAEVYDYRYPGKGMGVWLPYGFKLRQKVYDYLKKLQLANGYSEVLFPTLIPEDLFKRESEHVASFEKEVFWITRGGGKELDKKYVLRPTSETAMYYMFSLWVNSYNDLPLKIFQIVNVFRYETRATHPLYREREISPFFESHCAFATAEENEIEVKKAIKIYSDFFDWLGIPYLITKRPDWDKFPGAEYTIAFDTITPNGRTLQIGTVHNLGQNFSRAFDIKVQYLDGSIRYAWQMCFGVSGRVITALIAAHGDDHGLVLPPHIAPIRVVIIPIPYKGYEKKILQKAIEISKLLSDLSIANILDDSEDTPGSKYYKWELKGIPIRIEIGPRDLSDQTVTLVRRDTLEKITVPEKNLVDEIISLEKKIWENLRDRAIKYFKSKIRETDNIDFARNAIQNGYVIQTYWCGKKKCGEKLEEKTNAKFIGIIIDKEMKEEVVEAKMCVNCKNKAKYKIILAKSY